MLVGAVPHNLSVLPGKVATFCLAKTRMEPITEKEPRLWTVSATHLPENSFTLLPADADVKPTGQLTRPHLGSALGKSLEPRRGLERGERQAGGAFRKDPLVGADQHGSITHWPFTGHDKRAPPTFRRDLLVRSAEFRSMTHWPCIGHDKRAPPTFRRDLLVRSAVWRWIIHWCLPGTEVPRRKRG